MVDKKYKRGIISKTVGRLKWQRIKQVPEWVKINTPDGVFGFSGTKIFKGNLFEYKVVGKARKQKYEGPGGGRQGVVYPGEWVSDPSYGYTYKVYRRPRKDRLQNLEM